MKNGEIIEKIAKETLEIEAETLRGLPSAIGPAFKSAVQAIFDAKGRVIVTGVGKTAIIGQKVVATLNSTGTPAVFMHAADAIHGDLGIIQKGDILLCISKSGNTPEIKLLLSFIKNLGIPTIGLVCNEDSYLARMATYPVIVPVKREADPNNLAPTASTTAQLAMGDAMATALLALRGFTPEDFAQFHPGGTIGKQLYLRVRDLAERNETPAVQEQDPIRRVIIEITSKRLGATAVLNGNGELTGIITDGDLRRMLEAGHEINRLQARDIMTQNPKVIEPHALAVEALQLMRQHGISQVIVLEQGRYKGIVHLHDLIAEGLV